MCFDENFRMVGIRIALDGPGHKIWLVHVRVSEDSTEKIISVVTLPKSAERAVRNQVHVFFEKESDAPTNFINELHMEMERHPGVILNRVHDSKDAPELTQ